MAHIIAYAVVIYGRWTLELGPGVRDVSASSAWLAALVIFRIILKYSWSFLYTCNTYHAKKSLPVYLYINSLFQIIASLRGQSALDNFSQFE